MSIRSLLMWNLAFEVQMTLSTRAQLVINCVPVIAALWVTFSPYSRNLKLLSNTTIVILGSWKSEFGEKNITNASCVSIGCRATLPAFICCWLCSVT